jgi:triacylglycerol lipase
VRIPIWGEGRVVREGADLRRSVAELHRNVPPGDGRPVLLIPGYLASDGSLVRLARWLRELGYAPEHARIAVNVDCGTRTVERLIDRLTAITDASGDRVVLVGHSLGGVLARVIAVRRPELVRGIVCLGSPLVSLRAVHPLVWANVRLVGALGDLGVPGVLSGECVSGACCAATRRLAGAPLPGDVGFVSVYSRSDGIVDWRACLDPCAVHVEVDSSHVGMVVNVGVYRALAERLAAMGGARLAETTPAAA